MSKADGFKRGTNYNQKIGRWQAGPAAELLAAASQQARCQRGEHDETEAQPRRVTYVAGRQVPPGTRYCRYCSTILPAEENAND